MTKFTNIKCPICHRQVDELVQDHIHVSYNMGNDQEGKCREKICRNCNGELGRVEKYLRWLRDVSGLSLNEVTYNVAEYVTKDYSDNELYKTYWQEKKKQFTRLSAAEQSKLVQGNNTKERAAAYIKQLKQQHKRRA